MMLNGDSGSADPAVPTSDTFNIRQDGTQCRLQLLQQYGGSNGEQKRRDTVLVLVQYCSAMDGSSAAAATCGLADECWTVSSTSTGTVRYHTVR